MIDDDDGGGADRINEGRMSGMSNCDESGLPDDRGEGRTGGLAKGG